MGAESSKKTENKKVVNNVARERFTLDLRDDILGRFLLQVPKDKRPDFVRRMLEEIIKSGQAYDIADDYGFEISNPKGRSGRRMTQSRTPSIRPGEIVGRSKLQPTNHNEEIEEQASTSIGADSERVNSLKPIATLSGRVQHSDDHVQSPAIKESEQAVADLMLEAQQQVEKAKQDELAASKAESATYGGPANGASTTAAQRGEDETKRAGGQSDGTAPSPKDDSQELLQKVPPKIKLTGFFGEKPRSIRNSQSPASHESPTSSGESR